MSRPHLALSGAALALASPSVYAQSLSDAINAALAPGDATVVQQFGAPVLATVNCAALGGGALRYRDSYVGDFDNVPPQTVQVFNAETGVLTPNVIGPVPVDDGLGRIFPVGDTSFPDIPDAQVPQSEAELLTLFQQYQVSFVTVTRFAAGALGPGLGGLCQTISVTTGTNATTSTGGGVAGGASSASGRSVSSLSSAREQSTREKKRKKKKRDRDSGYDDGFIRLASNDQGLGLAADAAGVGPLGVATFVDFRGGYTDIDRDATALESGFDGRALWGQGSLTAEFGENFALAGSLSYSRARGDFDTANPSGVANGFHERNLTGGLFALFALPIDEELTLDIAAGGFYGRGNSEIDRIFSTTRLTAYDINVVSQTPTLLTFATPVSDALSGEFDTRNYGFSAAASVSVPVGDFTLTPGVEFTYFSIRQDNYDETTSDAFNNGLALSYSEFKDRWTETRIGGALSRAFGRMRLEGYGDLVLTGGAATPARTATFVEDLRADPYVLSYRVDDLDNAFGVFGLLAAVSFSAGVEAFVGGETNIAHDYLATRTIFAGVRFRP